MSGLNRLTGAALDPRSDAHLEQSIGDILTTPLDTRPMRRDYGSDIPDLVDQPINPLFSIRLYAAAARALLAWEPRLLLKRVSLVQMAISGIALRIQGNRTDLPGSPAVNLLVPVRSA